jgi:hypothetical protein
MREVKASVHTIPRRKVIKCLVIPLHFRRNIGGKERGLGGGGVGSLTKCSLTDKPLWELRNMNNPRPTPQSSSSPEKIEGMWKIRAFRVRLCFPPNREPLTSRDIKLLR